MVDAIAHSAHSMLIICACVVFFSVLIAVLRFSIERFYLPREAKILLLGSLEITKGVTLCSTLENDTLRAILCSFFIGWSGLCVHFQVVSLCDESDLSFGRYFLFKALQGIICALLSLLVFSFVKI